MTCSRDALLRLSPARPPRRARSRRVRPRCASPCCVSVNAAPPRPCAPVTPPLRERTGFPLERDSYRGYCRLGDTHRARRRRPRTSPSTAGWWSTRSHHARRGALARWADEVGRAARRRPACSSTGKRPTTGAQLCRSENFVPAHAGLRDAAVHRTAPRRRRRAARRTGGALQGEDQLQAARRCRVLGAPGRARVPDDRRARVGDDRDRRRRRRRTAASRWCPTASTRCCPPTSVGASSPPSPRHSTGNRCRGCRPGARCGSTAAPRTAAGPTARRGRAGRSTPPTTRRARATAAAEYYAHKHAAFARRRSR